jgi:hypothetical protein
MLTKEEMAKRLNNNEYRKETTRQDAADAHESGLVIIYGASDDLTYFEGVVAGEVGAWDGAEHKVTSAKFIFCEGDHDEEYRHLGWTPPEIVMKVKAEWCPEGFEGSWRITPNVPFAPFDILEDGELYCRGAVVEFPVKG